MSRGVRATTVLALAAAAAALAACGGDGETNVGPAAPADEAVDGTEAKLRDLKRRVRRALRGEAVRKEIEKRTSGSNASDPRPPARPSGPAPTPSGPLANEGTRRVAPGVPTRRGGDNSVQEFGVEASSAARVAAARALEAYLDARLAHAWSRACSLLAASARAELEKLARRAPAPGSVGPGCAPAMRAIFAAAPPRVLRSAAEIRVLSLRVEGGRTLLVYRDGNGIPSTVPMVREGGAWKVGAALGSPLPL